MLIGNKIDKKGERVISTEEGEEFAMNHTLKFIETSAKDNTNVDLMFEMLADLILKHAVPVDDNDVTTIQLAKPDQEGPQKQCC